jgi:hypothetical protein
MHGVGGSGADQAVLDALVVGFINDVRASLDPDYSLDFVFNGGQWYWSNPLSKTEASIPEYLFDLELPAATVQLLTRILDFDFDDVAERWPICTRHQDHSMSPQVREGRAVWACTQTGEPLAEIGRIEDARG